MERVVFVAEHPDDGSPLDGFTGAHAWALATRGIRPTVIVDEGTARSGLVPARVVELPRPAVEGDGWRTTALLDALREVVADTGGWVVIARGRAAWIEHVAPEISALGARVLWWQAEVRGEPLPHPDTTPLDGILTVLSKSFGPIATSTVGAGIDLRSVAATTSLPLSPPLHLLCTVADAAPDDFAVVVHALAIARGEDLDARLTIVSDDAAGVSHPSAALEHLVDDLGLAHAVAYAYDPSTARRLRHSHALVDGSGARVDRAVLAALASGVPVISSSRMTAKLVARTPALLQFEPGDEAQLARRIVTLSHLSNPQRVALGTALRAAVEARHSVDAWADRLVAVVKEQAPPAFVPAPAVAVAPAPARHRVRLGTGVAAACLALAATAWSIGAVSTGGDTGHRSASAQPTAQTSSDAPAAAPSASRPDARAGSEASPSGTPASPTQSGSRNGSRPGTGASAKSTLSGSAAVFTVTKFGAVVSGRVSESSTTTTSGSRNSTSPTSGAPSTTAPSSTTPATTSPPTTAPPTTAPPITSPPTTDPPTTTDPPPTTAPPATDPPTTTEPPTTTAPPVLDLPNLGDLIDLPFL